MKFSCHVNMAAQKNPTSRCIWVLNLGCKAGFLGRVWVSPIPKILKRGREVEPHYMFGGEERRRARIPTAFCLFIF